jgi:hypothetical protein
MQPHRVRRHLQSPLRRSPDPDAGVKRPSRFTINDEMLVPVPQRCFRDPADLTPTADTLDERWIWSIWVNRVGLTVGQSLPIYPNNRTASVSAATSQKCQYRKSSKLVDHLLGGDDRAWLSGVSKIY